MDGIDPTRTFAASAGTPYAAEAAAEVFRGGGQRRRRCCSRSRSGQRHRAASELDRRRRLRARAFPEWRGRAHRLLRRDAGQGTAGGAFGAGGSPRPSCSSMGQVSTRPLGGCGGGAGRSEGLGGSARTAREAHARGDARTGREARARGVQAVQDQRHVVPGRRRGLAAYRRDAKELLQRRPGLLRGRRDAVPRARGHARGHRRGRSGTLYEGELGRRFSEYVLKMGGIITEQDLAEYRAIIREPLGVAYEQGEIYTNGPPSAGDRRSPRC